jgi:fumarate reductase flavoprotein subunit
MGSTDIDIVVAGAGAAGLAAAIAGADSGSSVLLLEAQDTFRSGSNTAMSTSMIPAGGSRWQRKAGIEDSPDLLHEDIMTKTKGKADPVVTRALSDVSPSLVAWIADDCDVPLELVTDVWFPGNSRLRHHCVPDRSGRTLHRHLLDAASARPGITLVVPSRLTEVEETDAGLRATTTRPDGSNDVVLAKTVILATNGFGADKEMVRRHIPEIADGLYHGGDGSRGDALRIGESLGSETASLGAYQGHGSVASPHGVLLTWTTMMNGAVLINSQGRRFQNETIGYSESAVNVLAQPGGVAWAVFDRQVHQKAKPFADYQDLLSMGAVKWVDDVETLAQLIGCDSDDLGRTLEQTHRSAAADAPDPLGRTNWAHGIEAPYAAVKVTGALFHTQGGLKIDENGAVLRNGSPIPGLYAAGGAAVGISGDSSYGYVSGNGLLSALGLGFLAGLAASSRVER